MSRRALGGIGRSGRGEGRRQRVVAEVDVVVREIILVVVGRLVAILSRSTALLAGSVLIAANEFAVVGDANDRLAASGQRSMVTTTEHCLLVQDVCLPISSSFGDTSRISVASTSRVYIHDVGC